MYSENLAAFIVLFEISQSQAPLLKMVKTRFTDPTKDIDLNSDGESFLLHEYKNYWISAYRRFVNVCN